MKELTDSEWRDCYYVYRALHDGVCPQCGSTSVEEHSCQRCGFSISEEEQKEILDQTPQILKKRMESFTKFRFGF